MPRFSRHFLPSCGESCKIAGEWRRWGVRTVLYRFESQPQASVSHGGWKLLGPQPVSVLGRVGAVLLVILPH